MEFTASLQKDASLVISSLPCSKPTVGWLTSRVKYLGCVEGKGQPNSQIEDKTHTNKAD